jgi:DNA polymerase-1
MPEKRLVIIDGYSLLFRAFFATRYLSTSDGRPTNALFGLTSMLFTLFERVKPDAIVMAMDAPGKTFRHAEYSEYKGTRRETAPELLEQIPHAYELVRALGIPIIEATGYEADDVVGTISRMAEENGYNTTIVSGDLDQLQLVDECVSVMTNRQGVTDVVIYDPEAVKARYGIEPTQLPDWKAIVGDTSDNIPGVPGIGEKGATTLLQAHGSIESILENFDQVEPKFAKKIDPVKDQMVQSKRLATIVRDVPLEYDFEPFKVDANELEAAKAMLEQFEFRTHLKRLPQVLAPYMEGFETGATATAAVSDERIEVSVRPIDSAEQLREWVGDRNYALLFESVAAQASMFEEPTRIAYVAIGGEVAKTSEALALELFAANPCQAITFDAKALYKKIPRTFQAPCFDAMLAGYVLQSGRSGYALRDLVQGYLDLTPPTEMAEMASALYLLREVMGERLQKESQTSVLETIEQPLVPVLAEMEQYGITVSSDYLREYSKQLQVSIDQTAIKVFELAGQEFNIGSPKQLGEILFEKLELPGPKKTKTGYATGAEVLQVLAPTYPICTEILNWRELTKLKSTYADSLPKMIAEDGRIHTSYNQTVAATGRLSSNDPNLQNIPVRTELGRQIRKAFVPKPGCQLLSLDYSQIELRVLAHMCGEPALVAAFNEHEDVHATTASLMFNVGLEDVSKEQRRYAKLLNFAVLYGVTDFGLANQLGGSFSVAEARALIQQYNERLPTIKAFMESIIQEARSKGFTTTLSGRRRYFPDIHAQNRNERLYAERQAMNAPIQGTAADMIKIAMIKVRDALAGSPVCMLLQVHDELVFEMPEGEMHAIELIRNQMEQALPLNVPVVVDAKVGANWLEMDEVKRVR